VTGRTDFLLLKDRGSRILSKFVVDGNLYQPEESSSGQEGTGELNTRETTTAQRQRASLEEAEKIYPQNGRKKIIRTFALSAVDVASCGEEKNGQPLRIRRRLSSPISEF